MTKKFTFIVMVMLLLGASSFAQTATLGTQTSSPGAPVVIPLTVNGWNNVGAITMEIKWKAGYLSFTGITNKAPALNNPTISFTDSSFLMTWSNAAGASFNGLLFNMNFVFNGTSSTYLNFTPTCQVTTTGLVLLPVTYTNGAVNADPTLGQTAVLQNTPAATGAWISVPLKFEGFLSNVGSITQIVKYDPAKLSFTSLTTAGNLNGAIAWANGGIITITWSSTTGKNINWSLGHQFVLNFVYNGFDATALEFQPGCLVSTTLPITNIPVSYTDGTVTPGAPVGTAMLGTITGATQGQDYDVPLNLNIPMGVSSFTLKITYDNPRLSFITITNPLFPVTWNVNGNTITIAYTNVGAPIIPPGTFLNLKFKYNGVGTANVSFAPGCLFTDALLTVLQIGYTNGSIAPGVFTANASLGFVSGTAGVEVQIPVDFSLLPANMGAVTLKVGFDNVMMTYIGVANNTFGATAWSVGSTVNIAWASPTATNINGTFLKLRFMYNGGGGGSGATAVVFKDGCELNDISTAIVPVNWNNGGVNMKFKISGYLTYDGAPRPDTVTIRYVKVYLKGGAEPAWPASTPVPARLDSVFTNTAGYYEFWAFNGTYYLYATCSKPWGGITALDVTLLNRKVNGISALPNETPLRVQAGDVNKSGTLTALDVTLLNRRLNGLSAPAFTAPDWIFDNPSVTISGANVTKNFRGICSGDVNGSYSPIP